MSLKEEWKNTGKGLGRAFKQFGKTFVRSADEVIDEDSGSKTPDQSVFSDGSWRSTGKGLGQAFVNVGKTIVDTAQVAVDKIDGGGQTAKDDEQKKADPKPENDPDTDGKKTTFI